VRSDCAQPVVRGARPQVLGNAARRPARQGRRAARSRTTRRCALTHYTGERERACGVAAVGGGDDGDDGDDDDDDDDNDPIP